jgi:hypothetical protein
VKPVNTIAIRVPYFIFSIKTNSYIYNLDSGGGLLLPFGAKPVLTVAKKRQLGLLKNNLLFLNIIKCRLLTTAKHDELVLPVAIGQHIRDFFYTPPDRSRAG